jgi:hypothetical protein
MIIQARPQKIETSQFFLSLSLSLSLSFALSPLFLYFFRSGPSQSWKISLLPFLSFFFTLRHSLSSPFIFATALSHFLLFRPNPLFPAFSLSHSIATKLYPLSLSLFCVPNPLVPVPLSRGSASITREISEARSRAQAWPDPQYPVAPPYLSSADGDNLLPLSQILRPLHLPFLFSDLRPYSRYRCPGYR